MKKIFFLILVCFSFLLIAQNDTQKKQTEEFENISHSLIQQKIDIESNKLTKDILVNRQDIIDNKSKIKNLFVYKFSLWVALLGLLSLLGGSFLIKGLLKKKVYNRIASFEKECDNSIEVIKKVQRETAKRIENTEKENKDLRAKSKILIIRETETTVNSTIEQVFKENTSVIFNYVEIKIKGLSYREVEIELSSLGNILPTDFDLVVLDNCDADKRKWKGDQFNDQILNFTEKFLSQEIGFLYFSSDQRFPNRGLKFRNTPNKYLLAFVNAHANLYSNVMTVLKIKKLYEN